VPETLRAFFSLLENNTTQLEWWRLVLIEWKTPRILAALCPSVWFVLTSPFKQKQGAKVKV
jgi:hypothetical protein